MNAQRQEIEAILAQLDPPSPPDSLRDRALLLAVPALGRPLAPDRWARLYASRSLRAAWAALVVALVVANVLLPKAKRHSRENWLVEQAIARTAELRQVVDVPRIREDYVSVDAFAYRRPVVVAPAFPGTRRKEKPS